MAHRHSACLEPTREGQGHGSGADSLPRSCKARVSIPGVEKTKQNKKPSSGTEVRTQEESYGKGKLRRGQSLLLARSWEKMLRTKERSQRGQRFPSE